MKEIYYVYNNEAIASCVFLAYLQNTKTIDIARSCLILPFLLDDRTVAYLKSIITDEKSSLDCIVNNKPKLFASFNKRFLSWSVIFSVKELVSFLKIKIALLIGFL